MKQIQAHIRQKQRNEYKDRNLKEGLGGIKANSSSGRADLSLCLLRRPK